MRNHFIFFESHYIDVVREKIKTDGKLRGYRSLLAKAAGCQPAYLSQVLSQKVQLTIDQAAGLCDFWGLTEAEADFYLTLTELGRAGSESLRIKLRKRLTKIRATHIEQLNSTIPKSETSMASPEDAVNYYASWATSAVHMLLQINSSLKIEKISKRLNLHEKTVLKILTNLERANLIRSSENGFDIISKSLHVDDQTIYAPLHHKNWREKVSDFFEFGVQGNNLHYTAVCTLDKKEFLKVREILDKAIADSENRIINAKETTVAGLNLDWFEI